MSMYLKKRQIVKMLSGNAFKVFYTLFELTVKEKRRNKDFDGWVQVSHNQLRNMTGVKSIARVIDEFKSSEDMISIITENGISNKYKISDELINERLGEYLDVKSLR